MVCGLFWDQFQRGTLMTKIVLKGIDFYLILKTNIENAYLLSVYANTNGWIMAIYADFQ